MSEKKLGKVKVTISMQVEVDGDDWAQAYHIEPTVSEIRNDVKQYIRGTTLGASDAEIKVLKLK